jgi:hypothetical protein
MRIPTPKFFWGGQVAIIVFYLDLPRPSLYNDNIKDPNKDIAVDVSNTIITVIW